MRTFCFHLRCATAVPAVRCWSATAVSPVLLILGAGAAFAQTAPVVSNVRAAQRGDGSRLVDPSWLRGFVASWLPCTFSGDGGPIRAASGSDRMKIAEIRPATANPRTCTSGE